MASAMLSVMLQVKETRMVGSGGYTPGPGYDVAAFRVALAGKLRSLRVASGWTVEQAASVGGISSTSLQYYENAQVCPELPRLIQVLAAYGAWALPALVEAAENAGLVRADELSPEACALALLYGVTPEQIAGQGPVPGAVDLPSEMDYSNGSLPGRELLRRRADDPIRVRGALVYRAAYEVGESITKLSRRGGLSYSTVRDLLLLVGTELREPNGGR